MGKDKLKKRFDPEHTRSKIGRAASFRSLEMGDVVCSKRFDTLYMILGELPGKKSDVDRNADIKKYLIVHEFKTGIVWNHPIFVGLSSNAVFMEDGVFTGWVPGEE